MQKTAGNCAGNAKTAVFLQEKNSKLNKIICEYNNILYNYVYINVISKKFINVFKKFIYKYINNIHIK